MHTANQYNIFTRREFLEIAAGSALAASFSSFAFAKRSRGSVPYRTLGSTGEKVSVIGLGGYHIGTSQLEEFQSINITATGAQKVPILTLPVGQ